MRVILINKKENKQRRLSEQLRANLKRRKSQKRKNKCMFYFIDRDERLYLFCLFRKNNDDSHVSSKFFRLFLTISIKKNSNHKITRFFKKNLISSLLCSLLNFKIVSLLDSLSI